MTWNFSGSITGWWYLSFSALPVKHAIYLAAWVNKHARFVSVTLPNSSNRVILVCSLPQTCPLWYKKRKCVREEKEDRTIRKGWRGSAFCPLCVDWNGPSGSVRGSFDGFNSGREQTKPKEGRKWGEGGRRRLVVKDSNRGTLSEPTGFRLRQSLHFLLGLKHTGEGGGRGRCPLWAFFLFS